MNVFIALFAASYALVQPSVGVKKTGKLSATKADMEDLALANPDYLGANIGLWDPLNALDLDFWGLGNEGTIGYLRHAEIKHGRVAMAGFLGYLAQSTELVKGEHTILPYKGYVAGLSPPEQWDNMPLVAKLQIFTLIGMLESYGEILAPHYTQGGMPGYYPPIKGRRPEIQLNLYDPFNFFADATEEEKTRGRQCEVNNGRLAQLGIFSILSEAVVPGSVPALKGLIPAYDGNIMEPFSGDFTPFG